MEVSIYPGVADTAGCDMEVIRELFCREGGDPDNDRISDSCIQYASKRRSSL